MTNPYDDILQREIVTTRLFHAPLALVYQAWSDPAQLKEWWGPHGFTNTFHEFDFRPGGHWRYTMHGPNGIDYPNEMEFLEIIPGQRIVMDHLCAPHFRLTILFEEVKGQTKITFRQLFESAKTYSGVKLFAVPGNEENFDKLQQLLTQIHPSAHPSETEPEA